jgi:hypothetical protein
MPYDTRTKVITKREAAAAQARFDEKWAALMRERAEKGIAPSPFDYYTHAGMWAGEFGAEQVQVVDDPSAEGNEVSHVGN